MSCQYEPVYLTLKQCSEILQLIDEVRNMPKEYATIPGKDYMFLQMAIAGHLEQRENLLQKLPALIKEIGRLFNVRHDDKGYKFAYHDAKTVATLRIHKAAWEGLVAEDKKTKREIAQTQADEAMVKTMTDDMLWKLED
ncbi:hypothetical protein C8035_v004547 [Colletotrichum spinosum]|uniref:Uncharacterized protein n=1 Tax=Colletotrichum spinosum TaxID=1347390 RepID=A0A4R8PXW7_9PEZI|nr:hypothetical protein C8035_v004547 [Colletotrichum spinosum]